MLHRYVFHKESEGDLKEFLKTIVELQQHDNPDSCSVINTYLKEASTVSIFQKCVLKKNKRMFPTLTMLDRSI